MNRWMKSILAAGLLGAVIAALPVLEVLAANRDFGRPLTANEMTGMRAIYQPDSARAPLHLGKDRIWNLKSDRRRMIAIARQILDREVRGDIHGMTREDFLKKADDVLSQIGAITIGHDIFFTYYMDDYTEVINDQALLAHENVHVWQWEYPTISHYTLAKVVLEHILYRKHVYEYLPLVPGKRFLDYRYEQQGAMMQDYVFQKCAYPNGTDWRALEKLIADEFQISPSVVCYFPPKRKLKVSFHH